MDIGVREMVETVMPSGSLHSAHVLRRLAQAGIDAHAMVRAGRPAGYESEVTVSLPVRIGADDANLRGRIDGLHRSQGVTTIEEIKTTPAPLDSLPDGGHPTHRAQAMVYAAMYCAIHSLADADVTLTYYSLQDQATRSFTHGYRVQELSRFLGTILDGYAELLSWQRSRVDERNRSLRTLPFPFPSYRTGQQELMEAVERTMRDGGRLLARAATGIGKTMSVLLPAIRSLAEGSTARIFYLTARGTGRRMAEESLALLCARGARLRCVTITAKATVCFLSRQHCYAEDCPYALGYYDRLGAALKEAREGGLFTRERIESLARKHTLCPFELSLDLALSADCILCDYNYLFDPRVALQRFFSQPLQDSVFLIDEAHNLIERVRAMHSAGTGKRAVAAARRLVGRKAHREAHDALGRINAWLTAARKECSEEGVRFRAAEALPNVLVELVEQAREALEPVLFAAPTDAGLPGRAQVLELYYSMGDFLQAAQSYGSAHAATVECASGNTIVSLLCLDPARFIRAATDKGRATVFFSATLIPAQHFVRAFGAEPSDPTLDIPSPFPASNLLVMLDATVSTRLLDRPGTLHRVAADIAALCCADGNYIAFFPSYAYLEAVLQRFRSLAPHTVALAQQREMSERDRDVFLSRFSEDPQGTLIGFAVLGGIFAEGIDLPGERLSGVVVVGVGLPAVTPERELIRAYYEQGLGTGMRDAYTLPGLTRVLQAGGRLIRTETDRGALLLIDDRYTGAFYQDAFPSEWRDQRQVRGPEDILRMVHEFWRRQEVRP